MITLGQIVGAHGILGWVKIKSFTRPEQNIFAYPQWWLSQPQQPDAKLTQSYAIQPYVVKVEKSRQQSHGWVAKLQGCDDRTAAEALRGKQILLPKSELPALAAQEYYWSDLIGLEVQNTQGVLLGRIEQLLETGANDVLVVVNAAKQRVLIPYVLNHTILAVDLPSVIMTVDWDADF